jgi:hypothetical protein
MKEKKHLIFSDILDAIKKNTQSYCIMGVAATAWAEALPNPQECDDGRILSKL